MERRFCECGCGSSIDHRARQARFLNGAHTKRCERERGGEALRARRLERQRAYRKANRELLLERSRKYHDANRDEINERQREAYWARARTD